MCTKEQQEVVINLEQVGCKTGYKYLLRDINWQVKAGEHWVVFGMNGSGKTTLLSIVAGFKHYTMGKVEVLGDELTNDTIMEMRKKIGWVSASFFDKYYSKEAVMDIVLSGKYGSLGVENDVTAADRKRAKALLDELSLGRRSEYSFDMLSKGERQNVLIARALFSNPEILILDEPCTGLDIYNREYLFETLERLAKKKTLTIIYVTHYVEEIHEMFGHCLLLKNGHIFANDKTANLFIDEKISAFLEHEVNIKKDNGKLSLSVKEVRSDMTELIH